MAADSKHLQSFPISQSLIWEADRVRPIIDEVYGALNHLEFVYPNFRNWFFEKAINLDSQTRNIFVCRFNHRISGVAIAKRSEEEKKLCTLWVDPTYRASGIGAGLAELAFDWLGTRRPLFTVPEERIGEFQGLLNFWNFAHVRKDHDVYRHQKIEYVFNGKLIDHLNA